MAVASATIPIAWKLRFRCMAAIQKATAPDHLRAVATARAHELTEDNLAITDRIFPLPEPSARLAM